MLAGNRYKQDRRVQSALFCLSLGAGARLAWLMNRGNWLVVMRQVSLREQIVRCLMTGDRVPESTSGHSLDLCCRTVELVARYHQSGHRRCVQLAQGSQINPVIYDMGLSCIESTT